MFTSSCSAFEDQMRAIKLAPLCIPKIKTVKQEDLSHDHHWRDHLRQFHQIHSRFCCSGEPPPPLASSKEGASSEMESSVNLPPLIKVQGPFKDPEKVWRQKVKPLESTLRVATLYNSVEIARSAKSLKKQNYYWANASCWNSASWIVNNYAHCSIFHIDICHGTCIAIAVLSDDESAHVCDIIEFGRKTMKCESTMMLV